MTRDELTGILNGLNNNLDQMQKVEHEVYMCAVEGDRGERLMHAHGQYRLSYHNWLDFFTLLCQYVVEQDEQDAACRQ